MGQIGQMAQRAAPTMELLEDAPMVNQIAPGMDDVNSLIGDMRRNMARMPRRTQPPIETLGESAAEFTPRGGEGMYNAGRQASQAPQVGGMAQGQMSSRMGGRQR